MVGPRPAPEPQGAYEQHWLDTRQGALEYWFAPASTLPERPKPLVIFAHGNAELIDDWLLPLARYRSLGVHVALVEFRGYGRSAGSPTPPRLVDDFTRVAELLCRRADVLSDCVLYHGRSLGGGVACAAALRRPPSALVLQSTFTSLREMGRRFGAPSWLMANHFDNRHALGRLPCPCLLMHGDTDSLIPVDHAFTLERSGAMCRLKLFSGAGHNTPLDEHAAYWEEIASLLNALQR